MATASANATWTGSLKEGTGSVSAATGAFDLGYSFATRFEDQEGSNPEELIAAAHAGCYAMALAAGLGKAGFSPEKVEATAAVTLGKIDDKPRITQINLSCRAVVPDISEEEFQEQAKATKEGCPISAALAAVPEINLEAALVSG
ncbi:MAG: OsmC family peroxiredoxin [Phycisphaeraceae bacterium]|nr:OsmC family peroxiredoxin [Phycisphaeraceae bacterium]